VDYHLLNPYGCFLKAGVFDGDIPNLIMSMVVLLLFPLIVYLVVTAVVVRLLRDIGISYFETESEDDTIPELILRVWVIGLLMIPVGLVGVVLCIPAFIYNIYRFIVDLCRILPSIFCCCCL
jgi:uncharacterized membrane protein YhaH (DUF805 family)